MTLPSTTTDARRLPSAAEIYANRRTARNSSNAPGGTGPTPMSSAQKHAEAVAYISNPAAIYEQRKQAREAAKWK
ncbi:hypothetical protein [Bradyrhizobium elkanii]|uniref:Uncharacterized protein n=1 Tax=Bradyrhizobium elkanii TaxID=29448 RepID=A0A8I1YF38_BRAEL|nr:hypothetical protein [Bradyrhizobium elkanii]MBP1297464.1 hypothetical protein [Bradyrhizobium elkanii]